MASPEMPQLAQKCDGQGRLACVLLLQSGSLSNGAVSGATSSACRADVMVQCVWQGPSGRDFVRTTLPAVRASTPPEQLLSNVPKQLERLWLSHYSTACLCAAQGGC